MVQLHSLPTKRHSKAPQLPLAHLYGHRVLSDGLVCRWESVKFMFKELSARRSALEGYLTNFDGNAIVADEGDLDVLRHFEYGILSMKGL